MDDDLFETNLRHRFEYVSKFLNFTSDDILMLNELGRIANDLLPSMVDQIFQRLLEFDQTKKYFLMRHFGYNGPMIVDPHELTLESEQMKFRRTNLRKYLKRILRQRVWNDAFLEYLSHVGLIHTSMAGSQSINIDYNHINLLFGYVEDILLKTILSNDQISFETKQAAVSTVNKFFWIQNDFFAMHYIKQNRIVNAKSGLEAQQTPPNCRCS